ncbi:hypothetical protein E2C01_097824 [Portunus trituberculatus]|uniref:Uncharacterized protein n=1 Tax=Portunus trituberculatus TaxID=210409 RepID=A0A5B7K1D1_PORTR|nr:hypothetical protein [Portunus trituberculatus]
MQHLSCLSWMWIFKAFTVMGINVYYISKWMVRKDTLDIPKENKVRTNILFFFFPILVLLIFLSFIFLSTSRRRTK